MPQVSLKHGLAALTVSVALLGCSDPKNQIFDSDTGKHISGWLPAQHATYATNGTTSLGEPVPSTGLCTECHGADLNGGVADVSCTECHLGGPTAVHPLSWDPIYVTHGPSASANGTAPCSNQYCHGANLGGVANSGPACSSCHTWPFTPGSVSCDACHRIPPNGSSYPNIAGKHTKHATSNKASCNICHALASSYTYTHSNGVVNVAIQNAAGAYMPLSGGTPAYNATARTCSNISCHGGQAAPSWYTGTIDISTQCSACHASGTAQYNSYNTGEHNKHVNGEGFACTECHDTAKLSAVHFNDLNTIAMGQAYLTIRNTLQYTGSAGATGNCTLQCHGKNHNPEPW